MGLLPLSWRLLPYKDCNRNLPVSRAAVISSSKPVIKWPVITVDNRLTQPVRDDGNEV